MNTDENQTCPYVRGKDTLKYHHLFMPPQAAKAMDEQYAVTLPAPCGKPIHPGSCMCQEHMRFSRGYNLRATPYPVPIDGVKPFFTCQHSPDQYDSEKRWISHDQEGNFAGEFETEEEAKRTIDDWNAKGGERVTMNWKAPHEDAPESDRGTYIIGLAGTGMKLRACGQSHSGEIQVRLRAALIKYGFDAVSEILFAGQSQLTYFGWYGRKE